MRSARLSLNGQPTDTQTRANTTDGWAFLFIRQVAAFLSPSPVQAAISHRERVSTAIDGRKHSLFYREGYILNQVR